MEFKKQFIKLKEYKIVSLFSTLATLTLLIFLLFKMVLFAPQSEVVDRAPTQVTSPKP